MFERRHDKITANLIIEALRMKTAFGYFSARQFLQRRNILAARAALVIGGRYDPRQQPS